jgi:hypothetical protein
MLVVDQRDEKMFEGRILVPPAAGFAQRIVEGLFEFASETRHLDKNSPPPEEPAGFAINVICSPAAIKSERRAYPHLSLEQLFRS